MQENSNRIEEVGNGSIRLDHRPIHTASTLTELSEYLRVCAKRSSDPKRSQRLESVAERMKQRAEQMELAKDA